MSARHSKPEVGILPHKYVNASDDLAAYMADRCKRQAVTAEFAYDNLVDEIVYVFNEEAVGLGLDPWVTIDGGIDRNTNNFKFILCSGRTGEKEVDGDFRVFVSRSILQRLGLMES